MAETSYVIESAGVDWITVTAPWDHAGAALSLIMREELWLEEQAGATRRLTCQRDYAVEHCGSARMGHRQMDLLAQLTGARARKAWRRLAGFARTVSRLDVQVTVVHDPPDTGVARRARALGDSNVRRPGRRPTYYYYDSSLGGGTCYVGSPQSEVRGRVYDKGAESRSGGLGTRWRYEVQYRRRPAKIAAARLLNSPSELSGALSLVSGFLTRRGIAVPVHASELGGATEPPDKPTSVGRLDWLRTSVAPAVRSLEADGRLGDAIAALGLEHLLRDPNDPSLTRRTDNGGG